MRFKRLVKLTRSVKDGPEYVLEKIIYFKDMNFLQTITLYVFSISLGILCVDGLTETKVINSNKFASDLLISNLDACSIILWIIGISIFQPRRSITEVEESIITESQRTYGGAASNTINRFDDRQASSQSIQCITNFTENCSHCQFVHGQFSRCMSPIEVELPVTGEEIDVYLNMIDLKSKRYNMKPTVSAPFGALPPLPKGYPNYTKSNWNACAHRLDPIIEKDSRECL
ncbi:hypothetical protein G6F46_010158 [Rhizopus delemar]|uniref:Uncharacterized protein n=3 Tax=Rhizopus TaxID=4842 RepID=I1BYJ8_RHIO9|nr:hypothetical protein RO3G_05983 [Rhizopus delemar RA 99-880]KAG1451244.1 hypothetical protein G6F55_009278 [Rhizopus delemar]KAG1537740.1 hypothetical protein G6F51_010190 [Rhizopus arrhizus]KAG1491778.1 hypothetical protein G6F54_009772 [Rhizopus delemar]KAG1506136.1 hypothetical protein G6F53_009909 [Rhizopus delemar]|eukprot:EIE81278.1 hypothetical protein RO3G_05983 [Rhizopus delemar RA 99-880]